MDVQRLRVGWPGALLLPALEDDAGATVALDAAPTATAAHVNGRTTIQVEDAVTPTGDGGWSVPAPAAVTADLSAWIITWAGTVGGAALTVTRMAEVVGGFAFTVRECRAWDESLADEAKYPTAAIIEARTFAEQRFESAAEVAYVPRYARVTATRPTVAQTYPISPVYWGPSSWLLVPNVEIRRLLTVDGVAPTDQQTLDRSGLLRGVTPGQVVEYEHGLDSYPPEVRRATLMLAEDYLVKSSLPSRATSVSTDEGYLRISVAGRDGLTGIPEVDAAIEQYGRRRPAAG